MANLMVAAFFLALAFGAYRSDTPVVAALALLGGVAMVGAEVAFSFGLIEAGGDGDAGGDGNGDGGGGDGGGGD